MSYAKENTKIIRYTCKNCGNKTYTDKEIPRCLGCGKEICPACMSYHLCREDWHKLNATEQKKIMQLSKTMDSMTNMKKIFGTLSIIGLVVGAIMLIVMIILKQAIFYAIFGTFGGMFTLMGLIGLLLSLFLFDGIKKSMIKGYQDVLIQNRSRVASEGPIECPNCGGTCAAWATTCEWCGQRLK